MALAILMHLAVSTCSAMILGLAWGKLNYGIALVSLLIGAVAGIWGWQSSKDEKRLFPEVKFVQALFYGFILFAALQHFLYLLYYDRNSINTLHAYNFGDLSMHLQYIRYIAHGAHFWPDNPEFAGDLLRYPIGMDLYNALWENIGVPADSHLFLAGIIMTVVTISLLHKWMGWLGVGAFFLNGGLANWQSILEKRLYDFQDTVAWKNFFLSLWITQRGFLFAIPAGIYVIKMVTETLIGERSLSRHEKVICAVLWSSLAWFHLHTFFIVSLTLGICILLYKNVRSMFWILLIVSLIGFIFVWFSTSGFLKAKVLHIKWGWVAGEENLFRFWFVNLGLWILLGVTGFFFILKKSFASLRPLAIVVLILFFVFTFVMVVPWDWDNIKVLLWLYLLMVWLAWKTWVKQLPAIAAFLTGCILFLPGAISVVSSLPGNNNGVRLYQSADLWDAEAALLDVPVEAVLAVAPDPNHPAMFQGARVAMGYPGHLWAHGIDYASRESHLDRMFKGDKDWLALAKEIGVTHIYWGENEKRKYGTFNPSWQYQLKNVSRSPKIHVYDLQSNQNMKQ